MTTVQDLHSANRGSCDLSLVRPSVYHVRVSERKPKGVDKPKSAYILSMVCFSSLADFSQSLNVKDTDLSTYLRCY